MPTMTTTDGDEAAAENAPWTRAELEDDQTRRAHSR